MGDQATAADLGLGLQAALPKDQRVTAENWRTPPFNRYALQHIQQFTRTCAEARLLRQYFQMGRFKGSDTPKIAYDSEPKFHKFSLTQFRSKFNQAKKEHIQKCLKGNVFAYYFIFV